MNKQEIDQILKHHSEEASLCIPNFDLFIKFTKHQVYKELKLNTEITFSIFFSVIKTSDDKTSLFSDV